MGFLRSRQKWDPGDPVFTVLPKWQNRQNRYFGVFWAQILSPNMAKTPFKMGYLGTSPGALWPEGSKRAIFALFDQFGLARTTFFTPFGQNRSKRGQKGVIFLLHCLHPWISSGQTWSDLPKPVKSGQKVTKRPFLAIFALFDPFWAILGDLGHYGQAWAITHEYEDQI